MVQSVDFMSQNVRTRIKEGRGGRLTQSQMLPKVTVAPSRGRVAIDGTFMQGHNGAYAVTRNPGESLAGFPSKLPQRPQEYSRPDPAFDGVESTDAT